MKLPEEERIPVQGETDRVNGEYHAPNGTTQKIYSDAHYIREDENTVPPRYYTPPERGDKERAPSAGAFVKTACLCLAAALLGGVAGAAIVDRHSSARIGELETRLESLSDSIESVSVPAPPANSVAKYLSEGSVTDLYQQAYKYVVGVTTEYTQTNVFGQTIISPMSGTGFVVTEDGYIITNYHVVEPACLDGGSVKVLFYDSSEQYEAQVIGIDSGNDLAVLKISADGLDAAPLGNSDNISVGDEIYVVGNPLGNLDFSMTFGRVSALNRLISTDRNKEGINMFQIDAAVNDGNSGGPVYNSRGQVIGVVTAKYSDVGVEGLGFAIPINEAAAVADEIIKVGYVTGRADLGVECDEQYTEIYSRYYQTPSGALVTEVNEGSCAEKAGIEPGDIITCIDDMVITSHLDLGYALRMFSAGDSAEVFVYRDDEYISLPIVFDEAGPEWTYQSND